jgi:hypothetical protein
VDLVTADRKVREAPSELEKGFSGIPVLSVLVDGIAKVLALYRIFQFSREEWEPVQEKTQVNRMTGRGAVRKLPDDAE